MDAILKYVSDIESENKKLKDTFDIVEQCKPEDIREALLKHAKPTSVNLAKLTASEAIELLKRVPSMSLNRDEMLQYKQHCTTNDTLTLLFTRTRVSDRQELLSYINPNDVPLTDNEFETVILGCKEIGLNCVDIISLNKYIKQLLPVLKIENANNAATLATSLNSISWSENYEKIIEVIGDYYLIALMYIDAGIIGNNALELLVKKCNFCELMYLIESYHKKSILYYALTSTTAKNNKVDSITLHKIMNMQFGELQSRIKNTELINKLSQNNTYMQNVWLYIHCVYEDINSQ